MFFKIKVLSSFLRVKEIELEWSTLPGRGLIVLLLMEKFDGTSIRAEGLGVRGGD